MDIIEAKDLLNNRIKNEDWFFYINIKSYKQIVVYSHWINFEVMQKVPHIIKGYQVLLHFANKTNSNKYINYVNRFNFDKQVVESIKALPVVPVCDKLLNDLDKLEKICGANILEDIFFETNDGKNAVTNWSARYPEVRKVMNELFTKYSFDILYEELSLSKLIVC